MFFKPPLLFSFSTQGDRGMCQQKGKSDILGALSFLPHQKQIYYCNQLHFLQSNMGKFAEEQILEGALVNDSQPCRDCRQCEAVLMGSCCS